MPRNVGNIVVLARGLNGVVSVCGVFKSHFVFDFCYSKNRELFLVLCSAWVLDVVASRRPGVGLFQSPINPY